MNVSDPFNPSSFADMRQVLSLGGGVQSSALLLMACEGEIENPPELAVFADTGNEPAAVYRHVEYLIGVAAVAGISVEVVSAGDIVSDLLGAAEGERFAAVPYHYYNKQGRQAIGRRQCTNEYKLTPILRAVRTWLGVALAQAR